MKIVFTGGHHTSALPVIKELRRRSSNYEIHWFGHKYSMLGSKNEELEYKEITALGIPFYELHAGKFYRNFNIRRLLKIPYGFFQAFILLNKIRPDLIVSFGGYLAVPVVVAGFFLGIPCITHEQTVVVGYANKVIAFFAKKILVSFPASLAYFPKEKTKLVGLPLRHEIFDATSSSFDVNENLPTVYVTGGKTGSHLINSLVQDILPELLDFCNVIHQTGDNSIYADYDKLTQVSAQFSNKSGRYFLRKFVFSNEIGEVYKKANLLICRAGAHTVYELMALNKPAILIPISWASHNEQYRNAQLLKGAGLGQILQEKNITSQKLLLLIKTTLANLSSFSRKSPFELLDTASLIADEIKAYEKI